MKGTQKAEFPIVIGLGALVALLISRLYGYPGFTWFSFGLFTLLSLLIFRLGKNSMNSSNPNAFIRVVMGSTAIKILAAMISILVYMQLFKPEDKLFVIPFFAFYLLFTIYETRFLLGMSKTGRPEKKK